MQDLVGFTFVKHSISQIYENFSSLRLLYRFFRKIFSTRGCTSPSLLIRHCVVLPIYIFYIMHLVPEKETLQRQPVLPIDPCRRGRNEVSSGRKYWRLHFLAAGKAPSQWGGRHPTPPANKRHFCHSSSSPATHTSSDPFILGSSSRSNFSSRSCFCFPKTCPAFFFSFFTFAFSVQLKIFCNHVFWSWQEKHSCLSLKLKF